MFSLILWPQRWLLPTVLTFILAISASADEMCEARGAQVLGVATSIKSGELLYCELHYSLGNNQRRVDYIHGNELIVEKHLDFTHSNFAPLVRQTDLRSGELREAKLQKGEWQLGYQPTSLGQIEFKKLNNSVDLVIDAGFDNYVRQQWRSLLAGNAVVFEFASIPHLKSLSLRAQVKPLNFCNNDIALASKLTCVVVEPNSQWLRLFMGDLTLVYDEKQRLSVFSGPVNIQNDDKKSQKAVIKYQYFN